MQVDCKLVVDQGRLSPYQDCPEIEVGGLLMFCICGGPALGSPTTAPEGTVFTYSCYEGAPMKAQLADIYKILKHPNYK